MARHHVMECHPCMTYHHRMIYHLYDCPNFSSSRSLRGSWHAKVTVTFTLAPPSLCSNCVPRLTISGLARFPTDCGPRCHMSYVGPEARDGR